MAPADDDNDRDTWNNKKSKLGGKTVRSEGKVVNVCTGETHKHQQKFPYIRPVQCFFFILFYYYYSRVEVGRCIYVRAAAGMFTR